MSQPRQRYHHGDLRAAVLCRAEEILREHGADQLSLRQIARDVGVSHGAPSRHFRDKQALLDALAVTGFDRLAAEFQHAVTAETAFDARLHALAHAYLRFAMENPALLALMFTRKHGSASGAEITEAVLRAFEVPHAVIVQAQQRGELVAGDPQRIGMAVIASLQGLAGLVGAGFAASETADGLLDETIHHLLHGLRPRP
ncbi:TetR/AcrR family transcriptional regulator [Actinomadura opuntiae]|uniref:TetR/AcrR family transcriptional regulator n=1 Tax=Actinomadura sp. OS1-43 TaxID=604315 RepID=UPI00255A813C|nr:TetR/AcrR family transcriptional regulator [Actinomadura sp. OS1-43]MDL4817347.1 TetR/AcrR family transcriptional regulator [Actinomadura sp. OS1-43]